MAENELEHLLQWQELGHEIPSSFLESSRENEFFDVSLTYDGCLLGAYRSGLSGPSPHFQQSGDNIWQIETNIENNYPDDGGKIDCMENLFWENFENINQEDCPANNELNEQSNGELNPTEYIVSNDNMQSHSNVDEMNDFIAVGSTQNEKSNEEIDKHQDKETVNGVDAEFRIESIESKSLSVDDDSTVDAIPKEMDENSMNSLNVPTKIPKSDFRNYSLKADIRRNYRGNENIHYEGYKYYKTRKNKVTTNWICTRPDCNASICTMEIDGEIRMRLMQVEHSHSPDYKGDVTAKQKDENSSNNPKKNGETDFWNYTLKADIRFNYRGFENLYYEGYKYSVRTKNKQTTYWRCTHCIGNVHCKASATTLEIDGERKLRLVQLEHSHPPNVYHDDSNQYVDVIPDIQKSENGIDNLIFNGYKYCIQRKNKTTIRWCCTLSSTNKCTAAIHTMDIDGVTRMKVLRAEHTHAPNA